jgi:hypothetical protein
VKAVNSSQCCFVASVSRLTLFDLETERPRPKTGAAQSPTLFRELIDFRVATDFDIGVERFHRTPPRDFRPFVATLSKPPESLTGSRVSTDVPFVRRTARDLNHGSRSNSPTGDFGNYNPSPSGRSIRFSRMLSRSRLVQIVPSNFKPAETAPTSEAITANRASHNSRRSRTASKSHASRSPAGPSKRKDWQ